MTVRIKRLELHGFKSFPRSTVFEFDTGITAIIGPNGSGKSNIADAMRWVLGEQSYSNLRGRRAEDVIFSGSTARAPVGMAEVTLTLDNSSGELPIDFQEVSITRRAYRSGENQYLINGARVRLKDVSQITASLGQSHTVIGQGLVDAALSQRPEERRGLFEHAAGISGLRLKYAATARHLSEAETNSTRLEDLLNELEPRLRTLERQAKQAREYAEVQGELRETALRYFSSLWRDHRAALGTLEEQVAETERALECAARALSDAEESARQREAQLRQLRDHSADLERQLADRRTHQRELEHSLELSRQRKEALASEIARLDESRSALILESEQIRQQTDARGRERDAINARLAEIQDRLTLRQSERATRDRQLESLTEQRDQLDAEREELRQRLYRVQAEREYRQQQGADLKSRLENIEERQEELEDELVDVKVNIDRLQASRSQIEQELASQREEIGRLEAEHERRRAHAREIRQELETVDGERARRAARLDALQRLQESGEGLYQGVQAVLDAARAGNLTGVVGTLAGQITVPAEFETAIEAALGGHLQDVVVRGWRDAEEAIAHLKQHNAGRATFQPLDTAREARNRTRPPVLGESGVRGIAVDLIEFEPELEPVLQGILGRVVVTDDLPATRRIIGKLRPGWTVVTIEGEVSRSGGSVTGGSRVRQSGTLSRERELRELPRELAALDEQYGELSGRISDADNEITKAESRLESALQAIRDLEGRVDGTERELNSLRERLTQSEEQRRRLDDERGRTTDDSEARAAEIDRLAGEHRDVDDALAETDRARAEIGTQIDQLQVDVDDGEISRLEAESSRLNEREQGLTREIDGLADRAERIGADIERHDQQRIETETTSARLESDLAGLEQQIDTTRVEIACLADQLEPLAGQQSTLQEQLGVQQRIITDLQHRHRELERTRDSRRFDVQRQESQGSLLLERAADVLEDENPEPLLDRHPDEDDLELTSLETQLHRLRQRSRRIGAFGEETIEQYEQEQERYTFLRGQLDDVQRGTEALQKMLEELDRAMTLEFDRTFGQVAQAFEVTFQRLFGGGQARLVRTDDEDSVGIDIVAQPPGKRLQSLALLSGGERALTAAALLFAILRVNPSPFCLLDEVDAALDEANVVRFRDELRDLARKTQFVVVTHNRSTIEGADVLYGITMGSDAISRVVSLKLPPEPAGVSK